VGISVEFAIFLLDSSGEIKKIGQIAECIVEVIMKSAGYSSWQTAS
jgi:hypothetical protein